MKKLNPMLVALLIVLAIAVAGIVSKMDSSPPTAVAETSDAKASTSERSTDPTPKGFAVRYDCTNGEKQISTYSLEEVWAQPDAQCIAKQVGDGTPNVQQLEVLEDAYGEGAGGDELVGLYQLCASTKGAKASGVFVDLNAKKETLAAYTLCVEHPNGEIFDRIIAEDLAATEKAVSDRRIRDQEYANGLRIDAGNYLIGEEMQPGTWQSNGPKVTECYWEISDAQGNIIDNNFINAAPQFTITVPATASGFTASGCSFSRIAD